MQSNLSKLLVIYAVSAMLPAAEEMATAMRLAKHRVLVRDAEAWLAHKEAPTTAPECTADAVIVPPGEQFDDLAVAYMLSVPDVVVMRDVPRADFLQAEQGEQADGDPDAPAEPAEGGAGEPPVPNAEPPAAQPAAAEAHAAEAVAEPAAAAPADQVADVAPEPTPAPAPATKHTRHTRGQK